MITVIRNAISKELAGFIASEFSMLNNIVSTLEPNSDAFNHPSIGDNTFSWYSPVCFEVLMEYIKPIVEEVEGDHLYSTYSYGRIYWNGGELKKHTDRSSSEISVSCCLKKDMDWSLNFEGGETVELNVGDICIFPGSVIPHWRDKYYGREYVGAFLQYVRSTGNRSHLKWDTRPCLGAPYHTTNQVVQDEYK